MSNSINSVVLAGRITKEPELRKTQTGKSVCSFVIACDRPKTKDGESAADFISCVAWNQSADYLCAYAHTGDLIGIQGSIQTRSYDDQTSGQRKYVTEVLANRLTILSSVSRQSNQQNQSQEKKQPAPAETSVASASLGSSSSCSMGGGSHNRDEISHSIASKQMSANDLCWGMNGEAEADGIDPDDLPF
jgi:single-strand DNA-binding protein